MGIVARLTHRSNLESSLKALADDLAQQLVNAILQGSLNDLSGFPAIASGSSATAAPARARGKTRAAVAPTKAPAASKKPSAQVKLGASASRGEVLQALVAYLRDRREGARAEELRSALGLPRAKFIQATRDALATEEIRKVGHLRSTMYFAV